MSRAAFRWCFAWLGIAIPRAGADAISDLALGASLREASDEVDDGRGHYNESVETGADVSSLMEEYESEHATWPWEPRRRRRRRRYQNYMTCDTLSPGSGYKGRPVERAFKERRNQNGAKESQNMHFNRRRGNNPQGKALTGYCDVVDAGCQKYWQGVCEVETYIMPVFEQNYDGLLERYDKELKKTIAWWQREYPKLLPTMEHPAAEVTSDMFTQYELLYSMIRNPVVRESKLVSADLQEIEAVIDVALSMDGAYGGSGSAKANIMSNVNAQMNSEGIGGAIGNGSPYSYGITKDLKHSTMVAGYLMLELMQTVLNEKARINGQSDSLAADQEALLTDLEEQSKTFESNAVRMQEMIRDEVRDALDREEDEYGQKYDTWADDESKMVKTLYRADNDRDLDVTKVFKALDTDLSNFELNTILEYMGKFDGYTKTQNSYLRMLADLLEMQSIYANRELRTTKKTLRKWNRQWQKLQAGAKRVGMTSLKTKHGGAMGGLAMYKKQIRNTIGEVVQDQLETEEAATDNYEHAEEMFTFAMSQLDGTVENVRTRAETFDTARKAMVLAAMEIMSGVKSEAFDTRSSVKEVMDDYSSWWNRVSADEIPRQQSIADSSVAKLQAAVDDGSRRYEDTVDLALLDGEAHLVKSVQEASLEADKVNKVYPEVRMGAFNHAMQVKQEAATLKRMEEAVKAEAKALYLAGHARQRWDQADQEMNHVHAVREHSRLMQKTMQTDLEQNIREAGSHMNDTIGSEVSRLRASRDSNLMYLGNVAKSITAGISDNKGKIEGRMQPIDDNLKLIVENGIEPLSIELSDESDPNMFNSLAYKIKRQNQTVLRKTHDLTASVRTQTRDRLRAFQTAFMAEVDRVYDRIEALEASADGLEDQTSRRADGVERVVHKAMQDVPRRLHAQQERASSLLTTWSIAEDALQKQSEEVRETMLHTSQRLADVQKAQDSKIDIDHDALKQRVNTGMASAAAKVADRKKMKESVVSSMNHILNTADEKLLPVMKELKRNAGQAENTYKTLDKTIAQINDEIEVGVVQKGVLLSVGDAADRDAQLIRHEQADTQAAKMSQQQLAQTRGEAIKVMLARGSASADGALASQAAAAVQQAEADTQKLNTDLGHIQSSWDSTGQQQMMDDAHVLSNSEQDLKRMVDEGSNAIHHDEQGLASELSSAVDSVDTFTVSSAKAVQALAEEENSFMTDTTRLAGGMLQTFAHGRKSSDKLMNSTEELFEDLRNATSATVRTIQRQATRLATPVLNAVTLMRSHFNDHLDAVARVLGKDLVPLKRAYAAHLANATDKLTHEAAALKTARGVFQGMVQHGVDTVAAVTGDVVSDVGSDVNASEVATHARSARHQDFEDRQLQVEKLSKKIGSLRGDSLNDEANALDAEHTALQHWSYGFAAQTETYQGMVAQKLQELGAKESGILPNSLSRDIGNVTNVSLDDFEKEIATAMAEADAKIAAVMKDERLSEAEQAAQIQAIRSEAAATAEGIFLEQQKAARAEEMVSLAVDRYADMSHAAENATQQAMEAGHLSPDAVKVKERLDASVDKLDAIHKAPWLASQLQMSDNSSMLSALPRRNVLALRQQTKALQQANVELQSHISTLERLLPE